MHISSSQPSAFAPAPARRTAALDRPLLYRFEATIATVPIGIVPEGLRIALSFEGRVTHGLLEGARVSGVDPLLIRRDGVGIIDAPKTISGGDVHVYEHVRGYCSPPKGLTMPPLEAVLEPGFAWPDVPFPVLGFSIFRAGVPELAFLNDALATIEGYANFVTKRLVVETRLFEHGGLRAEEG